MSNELFLSGMTVTELQDIIRQSVRDELKCGLAYVAAPISEVNYLTRRETASRLKISLVTLHAWVNAQKLTAYKIGGRVLFRENEVEEALKRVVPVRKY